MQRILPVCRSLLHEEGCVLGGARHDQYHTEDFDRASSLQRGTIPGGNDKLKVRESLRKDRLDRFRQESFPVVDGKPYRNLWRGIGHAWHLLEHNLSGIEGLSIPS